jgi:hypothetical protein
MTPLQDAAIELLRAALDPASGQARTRADSPVCQVVFRAAQADLAAGGGADNVLQLAASAGVAASLLTAWLALERDKEPVDLLTELDQAGAGPSSSLLDLLKTLLAGPPGMEEAAQSMARLWQEDEEGFYDLIVDLGDYAAACIQMLERLDISSREQTLDDLEDALKA